MSTTTATSGGLRRYLLTRLALMIPMIWILVTLVFFFMRVIGNPIDAALGGRLPPDQIAERKHAAGFDRPILTQYFSYIGKLLHGDFGTTLTDNQQVSRIILEKGAATLELTFWAFLIAVGVGIPLGRVAARNRDRIPDIFLRVTGVLFYAAPVYFVGLLAKLLFGVVLNWVPISGRAEPATELAIANVSPHTHIYIIDSILYGQPSYIWDVLRHTILPAMVLGLLTAGIFLRLVRTNLLQTMRSDYVEAARARGVPEGRVVRKHAFRNALVPVVTVMGLQGALLLGGAILTERTFEWQGLGYALASYLTQRDFVAVQGIVTVIAIVVVIVSFLIDVATALIDPRVRY
ncbi:ABC transporter permease [Nakamurella sp. PAMC28650]|uniref:ABC transporter permease n=1 Tax=Nakamurella sp. PAMC28650 TaxID=2762325 RepID=UPI00164D6C87|nr:ABC transporter permease [Nakamurella sp. PAMC28650]QNK82495.1 ABC transporter permease [Nakamurella sp. PAMC28650]